MHGSATAHTAKPGGGGKPVSLLSFHGGSVGVQTAPKVYLVTWGWTSDPSGEESILTRFFNGVGGSSWNNSVTQYCESVPSGTTNCASVSSAVYAGNPTNMLGGVWDDPSTAPTQPSQSQLAGEAQRAAAHFAALGSVDVKNAQFVIATAHNKNASGFGTQYCAWHSSTSSSSGTLAYTNLPYITDAGASCGANFVSGPTDGITIVEGHEMAETETDPYPNGGWLDSRGSENGDKCAWISSGSGASRTITLSTGTFAVQTLWSNATGSCVISYP